MHNKITFYLFALLIIMPVYCQAVNNLHQAGARSLALANASITLADEWAAVNNQAAMAFYSKTSFAAAYKTLFFTNQIGIKHAVLNLNTGVGVFGGSYQQLNYAGFYDCKAAAYYARKFGNRFSAALQFDMLMVKPSFEEEMVHTFTGELSVLAKLTGKLNLGFHIFNPFAAMYKTMYYNEKVPVVARLGMKYAFTDDLFIALESEGNHQNQLNLKTGFEYKIAELVAVRAGAATEPIQVTFGAGVMVKGFKVDMAIQQFERVGRSAAFTIAYEF